MFFTGICQPSLGSTNHGHRVSSSVLGSAHPSFRFGALVLCIRPTSWLPALQIPILKKWKQARRDSFSSSFLDRDRALSGRLKFTVPRHGSNKDSFSSWTQLRAGLVNSALIPIHLHTHRTSVLPVLTGFSINVQTRRHPAHWPRPRPSRSGTEARCSHCAAPACWLKHCRRRTSSRRSRGGALPLSSSTQIFSSSERWNEVVGRRESPRPGHLFCERRPCLHVREIGRRGEAALPLDGFLPKWASRS